MQLFVWRLLRHLLAFNFALFTWALSCIIDLRRLAAAQVLTAPGLMLYDRISRRKHRAFHR